MLIKHNACICVNKFAQKCHYYYNLSDQSVLLVLCHFFMYWESQFVRNNGNRTESSNRQIGCNKREGCHHLAHLYSWKNKWSCWKKCFITWKLRDQKISGHVHLVGSIEIGAGIMIINVGQPNSLVNLGRIIRISLVHWKQWET